MNTKSKKSQGSRKAPRKHQAHWKDTTVAKRQGKRREQLTQMAVTAGWQSWSAYETAVINGETRLTPHEGRKKTSQAKEMV